MLDHVFMGAIDALRQAFEGSLLERQAMDERLQVDILLGDVAWETSYSLPGEGLPPRVVAEVSLEWPTWSQASYRSWRVGEAEGDPRRSMSRSCSACSAWPARLTRRASCRSCRTRGRRSGRSRSTARLQPSSTTTTPT